MLRPNFILPALATVLVATFAFSCSNTNLVCVSDACKPAVPAPGIDNKIEVSGTACTASPDSVGFPYKILFIIDVSGSTGPENGTAGSDPFGGRGNAVTQVLNTYGSNPQVSFGIITFTDEPILVQPTFTRDLNTLLAEVPQVNAHMTWTNYLDALTAAKTMITQDANSMSPTERARTRYDVEFLSDGTPTISDAVCQSHASVLANENDLLSSAQALGVLDIKLSTIFLVGPNTDAGKCDAAPTTNLMDMATEGQGTYQALSSNDVMFRIDYTSILEPFSRNQFYVVNESRVEHYGKLYADSDGDGVSDEDEATLGTDPTVKDTFQTGCGDRLAQLQTANPNLCQQVCSKQMTTPGDVNSLVDTDADSMHDCAESAQGTDKNKADTDGDNLVDPLEIRFGTNADDAATITADTDLDGVDDADEVFQGTDPLTAEPDRSLAFKYTPLATVPPPSAGYSCFSFDVSNIQLVQTLATANSAAGDNHICLYVEQLPQNSSSGDSQVTLSRYCVTANFTDSGGTAVKIPANGKFGSLNPNDFVPIICGSAPCATK